METTMGKVAELAGEPGVLAWLRSKHLEYYLALAERLGHGISWPDTATRRALIGAERANIRLAVEWAQATDDADSALRIVSAMFWSWNAGEHAQVREWTAWGVSGLPAEPSAGRERAHRMLGWLDYWAGRYRDAARSFELALEDARTLAIATGVAWSLTGLAFVSLAEEDTARARALAEQGVAAARDAGDADDLAHLLQELAWLHLWGVHDWDAAREAVEESLAIFRSIGTHDDHVGLLLQQRGEIAANLGDLDAAQSAFEESATFLRERGENPGRALSFLGAVVREQGDPERAASLARESLQANAEHDEFWGLAYSLEAAAGAAASRRDVTRAASLWGSAEALRERIQKALSAGERVLLDRRIAAVRDGAERAAFDSAWARGHAMTTADAVAFALEP